MYWDKSIRIVEEDGAVAVIRNVEEAADYLIWCWPRPRPCHSFAPIGTVFRAISDDDFLFDARNAFIAAAQEVGLHIEH